MIPSSWRLAAEGAEVGETFVRERVDLAHTLKVPGDSPVSDMPSRPQSGQSGVSLRQRGIYAAPTALPATASRTEGIGGIPALARQRNRSRSAWCQCRSCRRT